jgi:hypothetical protein
MYCITPETTQRILIKFGVSDQNGCILNCYECRRLGRFKFNSVLLYELLLMFYSTYISFKEINAKDP